MRGSQHFYTKNQIYFNSKHCDCGVFLCKRKDRILSVTTTNRDINALNPLAQSACKLFLETCKNQGINVFVTETYRSQARQNYLYAQGRTRAGQVVTWTTNSNHTGRMAWDIAVSPPKNLYDIATLNRAGQVAKQLGITWGGSWKNPDRPHFEIKANWQAPKVTIKQEDDEMVTKIKINLNGQVKTVNAINKDGNNYIKLQDIADGNIVVGYANKTPTVTVKTK